MGERVETVECKGVRKAIPTILVMDLQNLVFGRNVIVVVEHAQNTYTTRKQDLVAGA